MFHHRNAVKEKMAFHELLYLIIRLRARDFYDVIVDEGKFRQSTIIS